MLWLNKDPLTYYVKPNHVFLFWRVKNQQNFIKNSCSKFCKNEPKISNFGFLDSVLETRNKECRFFIKRSNSLWSISYSPDNNRIFGENGSIHKNQLNDRILFCVIEYLAKNAFILSHHTCIINWRSSFKEIWAYVCGKPFTWKDHGHVLNFF